MGASHEAYLSLTFEFCLLQLALIYDVLSEQRTCLTVSCASAVTEVAAVTGEDGSAYRNRIRPDLPCNVSNCRKVPQPPHHCPSTAKQAWN